MAVFNTEVKLAFVEAVEAALALSDFVTAGELLSTSESLAPGDVTPLRQAHSARLRARLSAAQGDHQTVEPGFRAAAGLFREFNLTFYLAVTQLEYGEWLIQQERASEAVPLLAEAQGTFERLRAAPWLERIEQATPTPSEQQPALS
jgi:hypothetical protein